MKSVIAIILLFGIAQATNSYQRILRAEFQSFKVNHNKSYENENEEQHRLLIFKDNKELIDKHNERYAAGEESFEMGVNEFTDLQPKEFQELMLSSIVFDDLRSGRDYTFTPSKDVSIPSSIDWRSKGAVTGVKNQKKCGSCWAFSAIGTLEGQHFIKTRQLISLSEQNLVDCTRGSPYNNHGCKGGWPASALQYIWDNGGVDTEKSYPYKAKNKNCRFNAKNIGAKVSGIASVPQGNEGALASAIAENGPISVSIDASSFQHYKKGVFNKPSCQGNVNHAVVVVGYGNDKKGGDYWLVKNSWGKKWGEKGYIRMARNRNNQCHIASFAVYPLV